MPSTLGIVASGTFTPLDLNPALWLDASDTSTITASGSPLRVSQLDDKSGNGRNLVQATSANQPTSGATTVNGLNVLDFTGGRRLARLSDDLFQNVGEGEMFVVAKGTFNAPLAVRLFSATRNDDADAQRAGVLVGTAGLRAGGRRLDADSFQLVETGSGTVTNNATMIASGRFDWTNADLKVRLNTTATTRTGGFQTAGSTSNTTSRLLVGANDAGGEAYVGSICEVVAFRRLLSADEVTLLLNHLAGKWGVTL